MTVTMNERSVAAPTSSSHQHRRWRTVRITTTAPRDSPAWYQLHESPITINPALGHWQVMFNLANIQPGNDRFLVRVEINVPDYSGPHQELFNGDVTWEPDRAWVTHELYDVWRAGFKPEAQLAGGIHTYVNGNPIGPSPLLGIVPVIGPWSARLSIAQYGGINGMVPFLIY